MEIGHEVPSQSSGDSWTPRLKFLLKNNSFEGISNQGFSKTLIPFDRCFYFLLKNSFQKKSLK